MLDKNLKDDVIYGSSDKQDWLKNHTLSAEQVKQLIRNKYDRAVKDHESLVQLRKILRKC